MEYPVGGTDRKRTESDTSPTLTLLRAHQCGRPGQDVKLPQANTLLKDRRHSERTLPKKIPEPCRTGSGHFGYGVPYVGIGRVVTVYRWGLFFLPRVKRKMGACPRGRIE